MNVLFLGTTGIHHTLIAANIYLGKLSNTDYKDLSFWGDRKYEELGYPLFLGHDDEGNSIYSLGVGSDVLMVTKSIEQLVKILNSTNEDIIVKPVFVKYEKLLLYLQHISRFQIVNKLALLFIEYLLQREFTSISQQVEEFKNRSDLLNCMNP